MLANLDARRPCRDRLELAANLGGGIRLQIKAILLRKAAGKEDINHRARFCRLLIRRSSRSAQGLQMIHAQAENPDSAGLQSRTPAESRMLEGTIGMLHVGSRSRRDSVR